MKHTLRIELTAEEVRKGIFDAALRNVDLGVPFVESDMVIEWLSTSSGASIELIPDRANAEPKAEYIPTLIPVDPPVEPEIEVPF
jgi:hypothetical protein